MGAEVCVCICVSDRISDRWSYAEKTEIVMNRNVPLKCISGNVRHSSARDLDIIKHTPYTN